MIEIKKIDKANNYNEAINFVNSHRFINDGEAITVKCGDENDVFVLIGKTFFRFVIDKEYNLTRENTKEYLSSRVPVHGYDMFVAVDMSAGIWSDGNTSFDRTIKLCLIDAHGDIYVCATRKYIYELGQIRPSKVSEKIEEYLDTRYFVPIYKAHIGTTFAKIRKQYLSVGETASTDNLSDSPVAVIYVNGTPRPEQYVRSHKRSDQLITSQIYYKSDKSDSESIVIDCEFKERIILSLTEGQRICGEEEKVFNTDVFANTVFVTNMSNIYTSNHGVINSIHPGVALLDCAISNGVIYADVYQLDTLFTDKDQLEKAKIIESSMTYPDDLVIFN